MSITVKKTKKLMSPLSSENPEEVIGIGALVGQESGESEDQLPASILKKIANI